MALEKLDNSLNGREVCQIKTFENGITFKINESRWKQCWLILGNTFINSQFKYAPLIWMYCRKILYHKIEKIHRRTLKVIYQSEESYENILLESSSVSVHQRHLRFLVTQIYDSTTQINPKFMWPYIT